MSEFGQGDSPIANRVRGLVLRIFTSDVGARLSDVGARLS